VPALRARTSLGRTVLGAVPLSLALVAGLGGPLAYSIQTAATAHSGASPSAGPAVTSAFGGRAGRGAFGGAGGAGGLGGEFRDRFRGTEGGTAGDDAGRQPGGAGGLGGFDGAGGNASVNAALAKLIETGASGYKWAAATVGSDSAASMELGTGGDPVMAIGGFSGTDPTPTLAEFQQMVASHEVHYFVAGAGGGAAGGFARGGANSDASQVTAWVQDHFTAQTVGGSTVYNLTAPAKAS
jgi:hypothetical protein